MRVILLKLLMRGNMPIYPLSETLKIILKTVSLKMHQNMSAQSAKKFKVTKRTQMILID